MGTALITGASAGLGQTFARKLAQKNYELILTARREDRMRDFAAELPVPTKIIPADLATDEGIARIAETIRETKDLELLVNNAGFGSKGRFWSTAFPPQDAMHRVHIMAALHLTRAALEGMVPRARGAIINVSSVAGFGQDQGAVSYCATKAWMNSFTEGVAMELRGVRSPVRMQALCPGFTHTEFHAAMGFEKSQIPRWLWMDAGYVVDRSLAALHGSRVIVIPNWKYKVGSALLRHLPAALRMRLGSLPNARIREA